MFNILLLTFTSFISQTQDSSELRIYITTSKNKKTTLKENSLINLKGKPFTLSFESPKNKSLTIQLHATFNKEIYTNYLEHRDLTKLDAWQPGSTMAISIVSLVGNDNLLRIEEDAVQGYIHDSNDFTSFAIVDSTANSFSVSKKFSNFQDLSGTYYSDHKEFKLSKAKGKTLYCIIKYSNEDNDNNGEEIILLFIIEI